MVVGDPHLRRSFVRSLEVIGEATKNLSKDLKDDHPEIEWRKITGMRDKLIHYYFGVDWDIRLGCCEEQAACVQETNRSAAARNRSRISVEYRRL